jgi:phage gp16-like protein
MTRALQRTIHAACRELGLDQDARHALQLEVCGKTSMSDMTEADLNKVLRRLKKDGFKYRSNGAPKHKLASRSDLRLVHVLWKKLGDAGALERPGRDGLNAFVRARFGDTWGSVPLDIDTLTDAEKINAVVRALKAMGRRADIDFDWDRAARR